VLVEEASRGTRAPVGGALADLDEIAARAGDGPALLLIGEALAEAARAHAAADNRIVKANQR
jgi:hypothetical protein